MTALEYRDALKRLGMTIEDAAKLQGITEATSRKRAFGTAKIPPEADVLLRLVLALRLSVRDVADRLGGSN